MYRLKKFYQNKWFAYVEIAALLCLAACFLYFLYHNDPSGGAYQCPFRYFLHIKCIGCGYTHALRSLLHGAFLQAHRENLLVLPLTALIATLGIRYIRYRLFDGKPVFAMRTWPFLVLLGVGLLYMILRNILPV